MKNLGASIRARLLNKAHASEEDFTYMLLRYAIERLLFRIGASRFRDRFLLKGATLFSVWFEKTHRRTQDIDLLGFGDYNVESLVTCFKEIAGIPSEDGMEYESKSIHGEIIKEKDEYQGVRLRMFGFLARARIPMTVEIGFGDAVTPKAEQIRFPVLLDTKEVPVLNAYPVYTVLAEKLQTIVMKGILNSRMKDFYDIWFLSQTEFDYSILKKAVIRTFEKRETPLDISGAVGLTESFAQDIEKQKQWNAFVKSNGIPALALGDVVLTARRVFEQALSSA